MQFIFESQSHLPQEEALKNGMPGYTSKKDHKWRTVEDPTYDLAHPYLFNKQKPWKPKVYDCMSKELRKLGYVVNGK